MTDDTQQPERTAPQPEPTGGDARERPTSRRNLLGLITGLGLVHFTVRHAGGAPSPLPVIDCGAPNGDGSFATDQRCAFPEPGGGYNTDNDCGMSLGGGYVHEDHSCAYAAQGSTAHESDNACAMISGIRIIKDLDCGMLNASGGVHIDNDCGHPLSVGSGEFHSDSF
jgi:hypothetical protein